MNRKKIILVSLLVLLALLLAFLAFKFLKRDDQNLEQSSTQTTKKGVYYIGDHLVGDPDIVTEEECKRKEDKTQREDCYNRLELGRILNGSKNLKECLKFSDLAYRNKCLSRLIVNNGYKDLNICKRISDHPTRESCMGDLAIDLKDKSICDEFFKEPYEYQECMDRVNAFLAIGTGEAFVGERGEVIAVEIEECARIKTLEYSKLCVGNVLKNGGVLVGHTDNETFENNWNDFFHYRISASIEDCEKIISEGTRNACVNRINNPDFTYFDYDNDGIKDERELWFSSDPGNPDTDGDGLTDYEEILIYHLDPTNPDTDRDGLTDYEEVKVYQTHPNRQDTDGDGYLDGEEVKNGYDPCSGDTDRDRLLDKDELKFGTDINNPDTDGDGINDFEETRNGFDPLRAGQVLADTDGDGLLDIDEIFYGTDRFDPDTDNDGISDKDEVDNLTNPLGLGDMDFDNDGLSDKEEKKYGTNPSLADTDGDDYLDGEEVRNGYNPLGEGRL